MPLKTNDLASALIAVGLILTLAVSGCSFSGGPRARLGYLPTDTFGVVFANPDALGQHSYSSGLSTESSGIIYTCKAGHMDIDHIRGTADVTRYLVKKIRSTLSENKSGFTFNLTAEMSRHVISFTYPADWASRPDKNAIIDEIAYETGPYLAYNAMVWHEILTWFGVHFMFIEPEFNSAFSWEDVYSDLQGAWLAVEAMKDTKHDYNQAMTIALNKRLKELQIQPKSVAVAASDKMRGQWYTGNLVPDMKMRNFDIGLDGSVTPILVPNVPECPDAQPEPLPAPTLETLKKHGFTMTNQIKPNVFEAGSIYKAAGSKKIYPDKHYPVLIEYMKKDATRRGYQYVE